MIEQHHYEAAAAIIRDRVLLHAMPRSPEYQTGKKCALAWILADRPQGSADTCPHEPGSASCDAWLAGWDSGKETGRDVLQEMLSGRVLLNEEILNSLATMQMSTLAFNLAGNEGSDSGGMEYALEDPEDHMRWREANVLAFIDSEIPDASGEDIAATMAALYSAYDGAMDDYFDSLEPKYGAVETWENKRGSIALNIPLKLAECLSQPGAVPHEPGAEVLAEVIEPEINRIRYSMIIDTLVESGVWSDEELNEPGGEGENITRLVWLAGWELKRK
ncbi:hypothetical protein ELY33_05030 [Vreelandella andesensis]|uniref:Uncharacterized protein n=1 Tax=Vreelandella andesensis TaxID=447567 RepID=A0A433KSY0_9GAMM|nr:hypothetical protein [Halomonas andesensis]RUR32745.1 hypothetical protein ELY33_05030 [Halomonas andesensis]